MARNDPIGNINSFIDRMLSRGAEPQQGDQTGMPPPPKASIREIRLERDAKSTYDRAIKAGMSPQQARQAAASLVQQREQQFAAIEHARKALAAVQDVRKRDVMALSQVLGKTAAEAIIAKQATNADHMRLLSGGFVPPGGYGTPPGGPPPDVSPISQPIDQHEEYRWKQVLTRQEYREKFGTERDTSPTEAYKPAEGEAIRIIYGPHPVNHEGHLRKTGKPCGHWAMSLWLVGTPTGDHPGVTFRSGYRAFYPNLGENDYHAMLNAESTSYFLWDLPIKGQPYIPF